MLFRSSFFAPLFSRRKMELLRVSLLIPLQGSPKQFFISSDLYYSIYNYMSGFNTRVPLWNASVSKQMLHFNRGQLKFAVNDILNKNVHINHNANQNYIEDSRVNSLRRFFLLSFTYSLSKTGLDKTGPGMKLIMR